MDYDSPEEVTQRQCEQIVRNRLQDEYVNLRIKDFTLIEDLHKNNSNISFVLEGHKGAAAIEIKSTGQGIADAMFNSIVGVLSEEYFSLKQIHFSGFKMKVKFSESKNRTRTDAPVEIILTLATSLSYKTSFRHKSRSMVSCTVATVKKAIEYFVNAELAVIELHRLIRDAERRNRTGLINTYINDLGELLKILSYEETIENIKEN